MAKKVNSENGYDLILNAVNTIKDANDKSHEDIKTLIAMGLKASLVKNEADALVFNKTIQELACTIREHNSRLKTVEDNQDKGKEVVREFRALKKDLTLIKKRWLLVLTGMILFVVIITFLYDIGAINDVLLKLFGKIN